MVTKNDDISNITLILDINDYSYDEMLDLFSVDDDYNISNMNKIKETLKIVKEEKPELFIFYAQAFKIIKVIYDLHDQNHIFNNKHDIESVANDVKRIKGFEHKSIDELLKLIGIGQPKIIDDMVTEVKYPNIQQPIRTNPVMNSFPNVIAPGNLNSIKRITQLVNLNLNTCFRNNYYNSSPCDFHYSIPTEIKNVVSMRLASIEIPNAWYLFSSIKKNNTFFIEIINNGTVTRYPITIPEGNYDDSMLENYLNTTYFYQSSTPGDLLNIKFSIDTYSYKSKFEITGVHPDNFCFTAIFWDENTQNMMTTLGWILGFRLSKYKNIVDHITSEGLFDAGGDRYIFVSLEDYQYNTNSLNIVCFDNSVMDKNIIAKVPMVNGKLSLIIDDNTSQFTKNRRYNGPVNIRNIHVRILDQFGNIIDLNNMDFSFTLELEILYEGFNFKDIIA